MDWYWNVATYCSLLPVVGGKARIRAHSIAPLPEQKVEQIHRLKEIYFKEMLAGGEPARPGVVELIKSAQQQDISVYWVTTTSQSNVDAVLQALQGQIQRDDFERIFTAADVITPKPDPAIYELALSMTGYRADQVLAIEDTVENAGAAKAAGLSTLLYPGEYALTHAGNTASKLSASLLAGTQ